MVGRMGGLIGQSRLSKVVICHFALGLEGGSSKPAERIEQQHYGLTADDLGIRGKCFVKTVAQLKRMSRVRSTHAGHLLTVPCEYRLLLLPGSD